MRMADLVIRSITGHQSLEMQNRYSTIGHDEKRAAIAKVIELAGGPGLVPSDGVEQAAEPGTTAETTKAALTGPGGPSAALTDSSNSSKSGAGEGT